jgi:hypothetical protein
MRTSLLLGGVALALTAAGCMPRPPAQITRLACPETQGELKRVSAAADGRTCVYSAVDGSNVELRLMPVAGDAKATLGQLEKELTGLAVVDVEPATGAEATALKAEQDRTVAEAARDASGVETAGAPPPAKESERAEIDLPGLHIKAEGEKADVRVAGVHIQANDGGATIRRLKDVRLKGEATSRERRGVRATLIVAGGHYGDGYRAVGYEAAGPKTGPLTVAVVKLKGGEHHDDLYGDIKRLVRRNSRA